MNMIVRYCDDGIPAMPSMKATAKVGKGHGLNISFQASLVLGVMVLLNYHILYNT